MVNDGVDLLIVSPNQQNILTPVVNRVYDRGIPVILFDRKTNSDKYTAFSSIVDSWESPFGGGIEKKTAC